MPDAPTPDAPWWAADDPADRDHDHARLCVICGAPLGVDPADDLRTPASAVCGDCARAREFDQTLWELDLAEPDAGLW